MTRKSTLLGLYAQTSIHAGTGQTTGVVDLPVQRESHTGWPCVFGSSLKGAMRADAVEKNGPHESIKQVYGPDPVKDDPSEHAGALSVEDARLLLLPVRSLSASYCWVTCPEVLRRLQEDARRAEEVLNFSVPDEPDDEDALWCNENPGQLFLEEYCFNARNFDAVELIAVLSRFLPRGDARQALEKRLVIVSDTMFSHLCTYTLPVNAHVRLTENKTVARGALWYEETLPPETLMYTQLSACASRMEGGDLDADGILKAALAVIKAPGYLQVGGNETVGMGWFHIRCWEAS